MPRKTGLGRGLDALISGTESLDTGVVSQIPVDRIKPNPSQPRSHINTDDLADLAASIKVHGILQPLIVTYDSSEDKYTLIAGERRLLAAGQIGLETVPAIVRDVNEQQRLELALIENIQRTDLGPLEAAQAYQRLVDEFNLSHEAVAERVGISRVSITNKLRLLRLPIQVKQALVDQTISEGHARALLSLPSIDLQLSTLDIILARQLTVRQTEQLAKELSGQRTPTRPRQAPSPEISALEERLRSHLGTKVRLSRGKKGGTLVIYFFSDEEFNAIMENILGDED